MGSQEDSSGMGSPSCTGGSSLCPWPCAGAAMLCQALLALAEGLLQVQLGFGPAAALRPPLLAEHEGSLLPGMALGAMPGPVWLPGLGKGSSLSGAPLQTFQGREGFPRRRHPVSLQGLAKSVWVFSSLSI